MKSGPLWAVPGRRLHADANILFWWPRASAKRGRSSPSAAPSAEHPSSGVRERVVALRQTAADLTHHRLEGRCAQAYSEARHLGGVRVSRVAPFDHDSVLERWLGCALSSRAIDDQAASPEFGFV